MTTPGWSLARLLRPRDLDRDMARWHTAAAFAVGLSLATGALVWFGYVATREWRRGTDLLTERRSAEMLATVGSALNRDMKGAWATTLVPINQFTIREEPPYDLLQLIGRAFARFPYPESFVVWKRDDHTAGLTYAFNRAERRPFWDSNHPEVTDPFPVVLVRDPPALRTSMAAIRRLGHNGSPFALVEANINGVPYQIAAHLMYDSTQPYTLSAVAAMTVNLDWVRREYFAPLLLEVAKISGDENTLWLAVADDRGHIVATNGPPPASREGLQRPFPFVFLDPAVSSSARRTGAIRQWTVHVSPSRDTALDSAVRGARGTFALIVIAAGISTIALLLTIRAVRAGAMLASMKSDFVSAVTHELKTPLALIRLVGDTLAGGRYTSPETVRDYAHMLSDEASRLTQSVDNLLTYARYSDARTRHPIELTPHDVADLVDEALERFRRRLTQLGFEVIVDIPSETPRIAADRTAMVQAMENLIDNAIKYSGDQRVLKITARSRDDSVRVTFADRGIGIPQEDLAQVFERFYRGRNVKEGGSGLGLAITQRILRCHGGNIDIRSNIESGTEVELHLAVAHQS